MTEREKDINDLSQPITLNAAQADLEKFLHERGWFPQDTEGRYYTVVHMMEEVGEMSRVITHMESRRAEVEERRGNDPLALAELEIELGDVLLHVFKLASAYGLSAEQCFTRTIAKNRKKYPLEKFENMGFDRSRSETK